MQTPCGVSMERPRRDISNVTILVACAPLTHVLEIIGSEIDTRGCVINVWKRYNSLADILNSIDRFSWRYMGGCVHTAYECNRGAVNSLGGCTQYRQVFMLCVCFACFIQSMSSNVCGTLLLASALGVFLVSELERKQAS